MAKAHSTDKSLAEITASLDELIDRLEKEEISIEDALAAYEEGIKLINAAQHRLNAAEQTVRLLTEKEAQLVSPDTPADSGEVPE